MPRLPLPLGAHGDIWVRELPNGKHEARAGYRDSDGTYRDARRVRATRTAASNALRARLVELAQEIRAASSFPANVRVKTVAAQWLLELDEGVSLGDAAAGTARVYRGMVTKYVVPWIGGRVFATEINGRVLDGIVKRAHREIGYATAKTLRSVLRALCTYAMRHGVITTNPAESIARLVEAEVKEIRALTLEERIDLVAKVAAVAEAKQTDKTGRSLGDRGRVWLDLPDLVRAMLATGVRLGELMALQGSSFHRDDKGRPVIVVDGHIVREGGATIRKRYRKGSKQILTLLVPEWSLPMWRRRRLTAGAGPMFASASGAWMHPDTIGHRIRDAFTAAGYGWVTSHMFRATVGSVLADAGLPTRQVADQLGHASEATSRRFYIAPATNEAQVEVLEGMLTAQPATGGEDSRSG